MKTLDRERRYDVSYGETNMRYHQDGTYFDAQGNEVIQPEQQHRDEPPPGAGLAAGVVPPGSTDAAVNSFGTPEPPIVAPESAPPAEGAGDATSLRDQLKAMKAPQVKSVFKKAGGPEELSKGPGAQARMIDWLIANAP